MLRWIVLALVLANAAYFAWHQYPSQGAGSAAPVAVVDPAGAELTLLDNGGAESAVAAGNSGAAAAVTPVCHMIGPFAEKISARQVRDRLRALDMAVELYELSVPARSDFWVHLGPMRSREEAMDLLRELQGKGVDSFLITEGELANGISLGFFSREELARAVLEQRKAQGYEAAIREVERFTSEIWAVFAEDEHEKFSEPLWQQIMAGTQGLERRKNLCDAIASARKLE